MDYVTDPVFRSFLRLPGEEVLGGLARRGIRQHPAERWPWEEGAKGPFGLGKLAKAILPVQTVSTLASTRSVNELYDAFKKISGMKIDFDSVKDNLDQFNRDRFQEMLNDEDTQFYLRQYPLLENTLSSLSELNSAIELLSRTQRANQSSAQLEANWVARDNLLKQRQKISKVIMDVYF
mgnify:FL=1